LAQLKFTLFTAGTTKRALLKRIINWSLVILYLAGIFLLSNQTGVQSNQLSRGIVQGIQKHVGLPAAVQKQAAAWRPDFNFMFRKLTHFLEFFILAVLFYRALLFCKVRPKAGMSAAFVLCFLYAGLDELHQWFVTGRSSRYLDIFIDMSGASLAILLMHFRNLAKAGIRVIIRKVKGVVS
jgi:VanZ family protein